MNRLKSVFRELAAINRREVIRLLNDEYLQFPALFILLPEIDELNLYQDLNQRNKIALRISRKKINIIQSSEFSREESEEEHQTLRWMLKTGAGWDGPSAGHDQYDAVIDFTAALLVVSYEDKEILPVIAGLIFRRNRKNYYIHDLVWAFFQCLDASVLRIVAKYLLSSNVKDVELACTLLGIKLPNSTGGAGTMEKFYYRYLTWLEENRPYLYLTGEHFQMTSEPKYLNYDPEAKYLNREISPKYREPLSPLDENEISCLYGFRASPTEEQELLSDYSYKLRRRDFRRWQEWIQKQIAEQVLAARYGYEAV
jgi:hypothetical protein